MINSGKVYYSLQDKLNNDLIKIIQSYNLTVNNKKIILQELQQVTKDLNMILSATDTYIFNNLIIKRHINKYWFVMVRDINKPILKFKKRIFNRRTR